MANDKWGGYSPKQEKTIPNEGAPGSGTHLDRVNPFEFRKGMDIELTSLGVSRLAESTPEEREKATETVLKNLQEHGGYYSGLIQFKGGMNHGSKITETNFKKWLENYMPGDAGTGMVEVDKEIKTDKMEEPKYDKALYTLKEAIKAEVKNMLLEAEDDDKKANKSAKGKVKGMKALEKEEQKLRDQKKKLQDKIFPLIQDFKNKKIDKEKYEKKVGDIPQQIKDINTRLGEISKEQEAITLKEKEDRRSVAETAMDREVHMELLNIIKEQGISLREGSESVKPYYEIAKIAYMEGLTAGLRGE